MEPSRPRWESLQGKSPPARDRQALLSLPVPAGLLLLHSHPWPVSCAQACWSHSACYDRMCPPSEYPNPHRRFRTTRPSLRFITKSPRHSFYGHTATSPHTTLFPIISILVVIVVDQTGILPLRDTDRLFMTHIIVVDIEYRLITTLCLRPPCTSPKDREPQGRGTPELEKPNSNGIIFYPRYRPSYAKGIHAFVSSFRRRAGQVTS